jgi:hypothetical protein
LLSAPCIALAPYRGHSQIIEERPTNQGTVLGFTVDDHSGGRTVGNPRSFDYSNSNQANRPGCFFRAYNGAFSTRHDW